MTTLFTVFHSRNEGLCNVTSISPYSSTEPFLTHVAIVINQRPNSNLNMPLSLFRKHA